MTGHDLVERLSAWLRRYVYFPTAGQDLIVALWIIHTWMIDHFTSTPYLCITARTKRAGKTTLLELVAASSRNGTMMATLRPAALVRLLHAMDGRVTVALDEMESLSRAAVGDLRSILTTGYRRGQFHMVSSGDKVKAFRTFGCKLFALIGDLTDVVRDRSIIMRLTRAGHGAKLDDYTNPAIRARAQAEASELAGDIDTFVKQLGKPAFVSPEFLEGREREIWLPLWTIAHAVGMHKDALNTLAAAMVDTAAIKSEPASRWTALAEDAEQEQEDHDYAERVLRDFATVLKDGERAIASSDAVDRLRAIPTAPWRTWRTMGINDITLAALLQRFSVQPKVIRFGSGRKASKLARGYVTADVRRAAAALMK